MWSVRNVVKNVAKEAHSQKDGEPMGCEEMVQQRGIIKDCVDKQAMVEPHHGQKPNKIRLGEVQHLHVRNSKSKITIQHSAPAERQQEHRSVRCPVIRVFV